MKPQSCKNKGRLLQNYVRDLLLKVFPTLSMDDVRSTSMGMQGEDVQLSSAARVLIPYQIECKSKHASQLHTYYDQAKSHGDHEPLVIVKKDRSEVLATVRLEHFLSLLKENNKLS